MTTPAAGQPPFALDGAVTCCPALPTAQLALVLELADRAAGREGRACWGWEDYTDPDVQAVIQRHAPRG